MSFMKLMGALLIVCSSGWVGLHAARSARKLDRQLRDLSAALGQMECELRYSGTKFDRLCKTLSETGTGAVSAFFRTVARDAASASYEPVGETVRAAKQAGLRLPPGTLLCLERLVDGFGRYDLEGQLRQLELCAAEVERQSAQLREGLENRCRSYEILGVCTGVAVMILVI